MKGSVCVIGLGYVGAAVAIKFANSGFSVTGIDIVKQKIDSINRGVYPLDETEPGIRPVLKSVVERGLLKATNDYSACKSADAIFVCVETPFDKLNGRPGYTALEKAIEGVGKNLKKGSLVVLESTIAPRTMKNLVAPLLEKESGLRAGKEFYLAHCPERVTPGKLMKNLETMDRVIGGINKESAVEAMKFYKNIVSGKLFLSDMMTAEVVKTAENAYRDVQIAFANELAMLCENVGIDFYEVRDLVNRSPGRNVLMPGVGVGGHCIPKDPLLLAYGTKGENKPMMIELARDINNSMPRHVSYLVEKALKKRGKKAKGAKIAVLGLSYLGNSKDIRDTPAIPLIENLKKLGATVVAYDPYVKELANVDIVDGLYDAIEGSDALVLAAEHDEFKELAGRDGLKRANKLMRTPIIIDGRHLFDKQLCESLGFFFDGVGQ